MKKLLSYILCACLIMTLFSGTELFSVSAAAYSGSCGDNVTWKYDAETATLTISGTGAIKDYSVSFGSNGQNFITTAPWQSYDRTMKTVVINSGVTAIGSFSFSWCALTSIAIPDSVSSIGKRAFSGCGKLTSITIPDSVTSIGEYAFYECGIKTVHYHGISQQWNCISIGSNNPRLTSASRTYCTFDEWFLGTAPTCTEIGVEYSTCAICGREVTKIVDAVGHSFTNYICDGNATCTADGTKTAKCDRCDATDTVTDIGSKLVHNYINTAGEQYLKTAANCTHGNIYYKSCSGCGGKSSETFENGDPIGHDYVPIVTPPTCTAQGYTTHTCSRCGNSYKDNYTYMSCGENCVFIIMDNTLYIHGNGDTDNYKTQTFVPWYDYAGSITEIIIDEGITKIGNYAFYCLNNLKSIKTKNNNLAFGKYAINSTNADITVFAENGGNIETYCAENGINYIDPTITPELETLTADSVTVKAIDDYEYSMDGANWQRNNTFTGLSPASEYNIYARYASTADIFDKVGAPLNVTTLKLTVFAPAAPDYKNHTDNSVTLEPNALYEFSIDGVNWQKSNVFTGLSKNTIYRFYQRVVETETEYASPASASLIIAIPDKPEILEAGYENILLKKIDGFEYCLDDMVWQESNSFDMLIDNTEYYVYQRLKAVEGEKTYSITSDYTAVITDNSIKLITHIPGDINGDGAVNNKDLTRFFQYLSDWDVEVNEAALDVNGDGNVNNKDLTRLFQYLSDWDVEIF